MLATAGEATRGTKGGDNAAVAASAGGRYAAVRC